ncbi:sulfatase family protein [Coraliomargarita akajimensis]|uniref:Sulfatase n=1 Tax=Coraliomargarita akajimensis (strain DSM 45221 / IAM 15411 / JCM 23193 / KCTC 12865 / 04OKA010-24) TaxID=583355 RepID=D5EN17_CORAD|nr:arylsulfatase [Coraliomargarita akajimensis]ADE53452.1 sulfatase [Coraliomargarita akajimensis DSM 45221]
MIQKLVTLAWVAAASLTAADKPNIVFIMADDLGLGDLSFQARHIEKKQPIFETPNIDALAAQGLWFTDGHSATALCAPTRYAVMSGNNNYRCYAPAGVWSTFAQTPFKPGEVTLGSVVRDAGYRTGMVGKWHMGGDFYEAGSSTKIYRGAKNGDILDKVDVRQWAGSGPRYVGFDYDFISPCGIQGPLYLLYENETWWPIAKDSKIVFFNKEVAIHKKDVTDKGPGPGDSNWDARMMGDILSAKAAEFITRESGKDAPFFLYYCSPMVHIPHCPPETFDGQPIAGSTPTEHLDMVVELDLQVKRIVDALKAAGEYENTLIVLTSDNGGLRDGFATKHHGYQPGGHWSGSKNTALEGGHRVPFIAVWPGRIEPGITDELAVNQDMVATFAALVGTEIPAGQAKDSNNLLPLLLGEQRFEQRDYFVNQAGSKQELMYRKDGWKLIIQSTFKRTKYDPLALYNLNNDPKETKNLIKNPEYQQLVKKMHAEYLEIIESGVATAPGRN